MKTYRNIMTKLATAFAGFLLIGLLAACGDTSNMDSSVPLPTVTPMGSATPVLGLVTATATPDVAQFAPPTQVVTAQPIVTVTPVPFYTATVVNSQNDDNQGDNNSTSDNNQGQGPDKGKPEPPSKPNPPGKDGGKKGKK